MRKWIMEFLVEFNILVPQGTQDAEVSNREHAEAAAAADLVRGGHLLRLWRPRAAPGETRAVGLYRAQNEEELDGLLGDLPMNSWMEITVTALERHPNDPANPHASGSELPNPQIVAIYRLEASLGEPIELGDTAMGHRRIVPLTGGTFTGPEISGTLIPGASADWQTRLPDGTVLGDIRYVLKTDAGAVLDVQSHSIRHGSPEVLARLSRGEDVNASEYTFRTSTRITTAAPELDWLNKGVFVSVAGRQPAGVIYETHLVA
jgi:muconolactone delta-isomerase